jgi:mRNA interferase RelE/StbE
MNWTVELAPATVKEIDKLAPQVSQRMRRFLVHLSSLENPRGLGEALHGSKPGELWKYRVGDFRLICSIEDDRLIVLVLRVGNRREIYKRV